VILQGSFYGTVRSGHKGVRIVSMRRLITTRRCMTECFAMAGERALLRFVNCWSMTGAFRRRSFRSGPCRDGGRVISRGIQGTPCCSMAGTATALRRNALRTYRASRMASRPFPRTSPMITRMPYQVGHDLIQIIADRGLTCRRAVAGSCHGQAHISRGGCWCGRIGPRDRRSAGSLPALASMGCAELRSPGRLCVR